MKIPMKPIALLAAGATFFPADAEACAVCIGWAEGQGLGGFYWSALLLTALPFAVIAAIGAWVWREHRVTGAGGEGAPSGSSTTRVTTTRRI